MEGQGNDERKKNYSIVSSGRFFSSRFATVSQYKSKKRHRDTSDLLLIININAFIPCYSCSFTLNHLNEWRTADDLQQPNQWDENQQFKGPIRSKKNKNSFHQWLSAVPSVPIRSVRCEKPLIPRHREDISLLWCHKGHQHLPQLSDHTHQLAVGTALWNRPPPNVSRGRFWL